MRTPRTKAEDQDMDAVRNDIELTRIGLLQEVCGVAVGALYAVGKMEVLTEDLQQYAATLSLPDKEVWPSAGFGLGHPLGQALVYEFVNLLGWVRAVDESLDRPHRPGSNKRVGLLPELAERRPAKGVVDALVTDFRSETLERHLANYFAHAALDPIPLGGVRITTDGGVRLNVADRLTSPVDTRRELTFENGRDALSVARNVAQESRIASGRPTHRVRNRHGLDHGGKGRTNHHLNPASPLRGGRSHPLVPPWPAATTKCGRYRAISIGGPTTGIGRTGPAAPNPTPTRRRRRRRR